MCITRTILWISTRSLSTIVSSTPPLPAHQLAGFLLACKLTAVLLPPMELIGQVGRFLRVFTIQLRAAPAEESLLSEPTAVLLHPMEYLGQLTRFLREITSTSFSRHITTSLLLRQRVGESRQLTTFWSSSPIDILPAQKCWFPA